MAVPTWVNPAWKDDENFLLSKLEIDTWKLKVATVAGCLWRSSSPQMTCLPLAEEVTEVPAITVVQA